jgi:hypothetical protein
MNSRRMFSLPFSVPPITLFVLCIVAILCAGILNGCTTMQGAFQSLTDPKNAVAQQITVQYATGKFIEAKGTPAERIARASQVKAVATSIQAVAASDSATIAALHELAASKIAAAHLSPSDRLLADSLVNAVVDELSARVAGGTLTPENRVYVSRLLGWVIAAADAYAPGA